MGRGILRMHRRAIAAALAAALAAAAMAMMALECTPHLVGVPWLVLGWLCLWMSLELRLLLQRSRRSQRNAHSTSGFRKKNQKLIRHRGPRRSGWLSACSVKRRQF